MGGGNFFDTSFMKDWHDDLMNLVYASIKYGFDLSNENVNFYMDATDKDMALHILKSVKGK